MAEYKLTGSIQDDENSGLMINYFPSWLIDEDTNGEGKEIGANYGVLL